MLAEQLDALADLRASSSFDYYVADSADGRPLHYRVSGDIYDGRVSDPSFPYTFTDLSADYVVSNDGVEFRNLKAKSGQTELNLTYEGGGFEPGKPFSLTASAERLPLDERLARSLPPGMQKLWSKFNPSGEIGVTVTLNYDGQAWSPIVHAQVWRLNYLFKAFPYQVDNARGVMHLEKDELTLDLHTTISGQRVDLKGRLKLQPNAPPLGRVTIQSSGPIAVDEKLIAALGPQQQKFARALNFSGLIDGIARFERTPEDPIFRTYVMMDISRGQMRYRPAPYPVSQIEGRIHISDSGWRIERLEGFNNAARITAGGNFVIDPRWDGDFEFHLDIQGVDVALDNTLRRALPPQSQKVWNSLAPQGVLNSLRVKVDKRLGKKKPDYHVVATRTESKDARGSISIRPSWLPYRWDRVTGVAEFDNGDVSLRELTGRHGPSALTLDAKGRFDDIGWRMDLTRFSLENVVINHDFVSAIRPLKLQRLLTNSQLSGAGRVEGAMSFSGRSNTDVVTSNWDVYIDLENGALDLGAPARAIRGGVRLIGGYDGTRFSTTGSLAIDSMLLNNVHLTRVNGPLVR